MHTTKIPEARTKKVVCSCFHHYGTRRSLIIVNAGIQDTSRREVNYVVENAVELRPWSFSSRAVQISDSRFAKEDDEHNEELDCLVTLVASGFLVSAKTATGSVATICDSVVASMLSWTARA